MAASMGQGSCRYAVRKTWTCRFLLFSGCFCTAFSTRSNDDKLVSDLIVEPSIDTEIKADSVHSTVLLNAKELGLAVVGKNLESYIKNFETAVARLREHSAGKGSRSSSLTEEDVEDGSSIRLVPRSKFCPSEWMPMVATQGREVGRGQYGVVYVANISCNDENVAQMAFKVQIDKSKTEDPDDWKTDQKNWLHEIKVGMSFDHPYIIKFFGSSIFTNGMRVIAMEAAGDDLQKRFVKGRRHESVNQAELAEFVLQILWGLKHMHHKGYVHADLKPEQVMVQCSSLPACEVRIADLGLAVRSTMERPYKGVQGSPLYLAPEVFVTGQIFPAADMWALGVSLYQILKRGEMPVPATALRELEKKLSNYYNLGNKPASVQDSIISYPQTARDELLHGLLKFNLMNRINASSAIQLAQKWAEAEGVDQSRIDAIMLKGQEADEGKAFGVMRPSCWPKRKNS